MKLTALRGSPVEGDACANCYYYLEPGADLAFCWHEKLQIARGVAVVVPLLGDDRGLVSRRRHPSRAPGGNSSGRCSISRSDCR